MAELNEPTATEAAFRQGYQAAVDELRGERRLLDEPAPPPKRNLTYEQQLKIRVEKLERLLGERDETIRRTLTQVGLARADRVRAVGDKRRLVAHIIGLGQALSLAGLDVPPLPEEEDDGLERGDDRPDRRDDAGLPEGGGGLP
jgi:hypothetical protein